MHSKQDLDSALWSCLVLQEKSSYKPVPLPLKNFLCYFSHHKLLFSPLLCRHLKYKIPKELLHLNPLRNKLLLPSELLNPRGAPWAGFWAQLCTDSDCPQGPWCPRAGSPPRSSWQAEPWSTQPMFVHYPFPFGCCLCFVSSSPPYTGSWGLKLNPAHSVLCSSSYHYKCTHPEKKKNQQKKNRMESSRNSIFAKLLHGEIISLFFLDFFFFFWEKTEGKINKFPQLNKHTESYSSRQRADNPNLKGTNKLCNHCYGQKNLECPNIFIHRFQCHSSGTFTPVGLGKQQPQHLWEMGRKMERMWLKGHWAWPQPSGNPEHQIKGAKRGRTHLQL